MYLFVYASFSHHLSVVCVVAVEKLITVYTFTRILHSSSMLPPFDDGVSNKLLCLIELSSWLRLLFKAGLGWATAPAAAPIDELVEVGTERCDMPAPPDPGLFYPRPRLAPNLDWKPNLRLSMLLSVPYVDLLVPWPNV